MASHCYAMTLVSTTVNGHPALAPKYIVQGLGAGIPLPSPRAVLTFSDPSVVALLGNYNACILVAVVTPEQDAALRSFLDVIATPVPANSPQKLKDAAALALATAHQNPEFADAT
jgi:hypothetical protein